jgi:hypothetical protein
MINCDNRPEHGTTVPSTFENVKRKKNKIVRPWHHRSQSHIALLITRLIARTVRFCKTKRSHECQTYHRFSQTESFSSFPLLSLTKTVDKTIVNDSRENEPNCSVCADLW